LTSEAAAARVAELLSTEESEKWYARLDRLQLETGIRGAERAGRYDLAKERLDVARQRHPEHAIVLIDEFKHIDGAIGEDLRNPTSAVCRLQELHRRLKEILAPIDFDLRYQHTNEEDVADATLPCSAEEAAPVISRPRVRHPSPQARGVELEDATVNLLGQMFDLALDDAEALRTTLWRQRSGYQFGHDIRFTAPATNNRNVQCHVECKNYSGNVRPADIADKLLQQRSSSRVSPIDHWILISPHADPSNDLAEMLREWEANDDWDFTVQVWSPETRVRDFFALAPEVYRTLYGEEPSPIAPVTVMDEFRKRIEPKAEIAEAFPHVSLRAVANVLFY
jgi:hypothetical protein